MTRSIVRLVSRTSWDTTFAGDAVRGVWEDRDDAKRRKVAVTCFFVLCALWLAMLVAPGCDEIPTAERVVVDGEH